MNSKITQGNFSKTLKFMGWNKVKCKRLSSRVIVIMNKIKEYSDDITDKRIVEKYRETCHLNLNMLL